MKALRDDYIFLITFHFRYWFERHFSHLQSKIYSLPSSRTYRKKMNIEFHGCWIRKTNTEKHTNTLEISSYSKLCDVLWPTQSMFSHDFCHVSRCSEHVRFSRACTEAQVISTVGVFGEYSLIGLQADILGGHNTRKGSIRRCRRKVPVGMAGSWPGGLQTQAHIPISRFVLQKDSRHSDNIPSALDPAEVRSKIWGFDVLTLGCLNALPLHQMVPVACWEQPGSVTGPTCGFNYSAWRGDAVERKERGK